MYLKKAMCFFLFATAAFALPIALNRFQQENANKVRADGTAPPPPPIRWLSRGQTGPQLNADGIAPPPPPIKWPSRAQTGPQLSADGTAPPPPPIRRFKSSGASSFRTDV